MNKSKRFRLSVIAAAVASAFGPAAMAAEEDEDLIELKTPLSTVEGGIGFANADGPRFGQYNGLKDKGPYLLFDLDYRKRDDPTGTWMQLYGRNLGLDSRELRWDHYRQGNWGYFIDYNEIVRFEPFTPVTGLTGIGTGSQTINGTGLRPVDLDTRRSIWTVGAQKFVSGGFDFQASFRNEEKSGARMWGQGDSPFPAAVQQTRFLTDPIDYSTRQWEAMANYTSGKLQLSAGYYGTYFDNHNAALAVSGAPAPIFPLMATPPGNQSHQLYLNGGYNFTPMTRLNFKVGYTHLAQNEPFIAPAAVGVNRTDLGGVINTTFGFLGFTAQPLPKLNVLANLRFDERDDQTPVARYFTGVGAGSTLSGENEPRSIRSISGKFEAGYRLPWGFRATAGIDYLEQHRNFYQVRVVSARTRTDEWSARAELRRSIGDSLTGAVAYMHSDRYGSEYMNTVLAGGAASSNLIAPLFTANRVRDKVRSTLTWVVSDPLSIQFMVENGKDRYDSRTPALDLGVRQGGMYNYTVDASYQFSEKWQANAWFTRNGANQDQAFQFPGGAGFGLSNWQANLGNDSDSVGVGVHGKPHAKFDLSADLLYSRINDRFGIQQVSGAPSPGSDIPAIHTTVMRATLAARYAMQKNLGFRFQYIYDRWNTNDWTWANFVYSDGTRVNQDPSQAVHFFGVTAYYQFR